jgi:hypothetical protein
MPDLAETQRFCQLQIHLCGDTQSDVLMLVLDVTEVHQLIVRHKC